MWRDTPIDQQKVLSGSPKNPNHLQMAPNDKDQTTNLPEPVQIILIPPWWWGAIREHDFQETGNESTKYCPILNKFAKEMKKDAQNNKYNSVAASKYCNPHEQIIHVTHRNPPRRVVRGNKRKRRHPNILYDRLLYHQNLIPVCFFNSAGRRVCRLFTLVPETMPLYSVKIMISQWKNARPASW